MLIDGDGAKFLDYLIANPTSGAAEAAQRLRQGVRDFLKDTTLGAEDLSVLARVVATHFTNSRAEFNFVDVGPGKENAHSKMRS